MKFVKLNQSQYVNLDTVIMAEDYPDRVVLTHLGGHHNDYRGDEADAIRLAIGSVEQIANGKRRGQMVKA